jgi:hypothetical protein
MKHGQITLAYSAENLATVAKRYLHMQIDEVVAV